MILLDKFKFIFTVSKGFNKYNQFKHLNIIIFNKIIYNVIGKKLEFNYYIQIFILR